MNETIKSNMNSNIEQALATYQRTWVEVNLDSISENMRKMKENVAKQTQMLAVIKTDGYGHGAVPIARCLEDADYVYGFATATADFAIG